MNVISEGLRDENGVGDIAYIAVAGLLIIVFLSMTYLVGMSTIDYILCQPTTTVTQGGEQLTSVVPCRFDMLAFGQAIGLILAAYSPVLASLAGYMAATRRRAITTTTTTASSKGGGTTVTESQ